jgi:hypothetical protein
VFSRLSSIGYEHHMIFLNLCAFSCILLDLFLLAWVIQFNFFVSSSFDGRCLTSYHITMPVITRSQSRLLCSTGSNDEFSNSYSDTTGSIDGPLFSCSVSQGKKVSVKYKLHPKT